jgi:hypothetical protein
MNMANPSTLPTLNLKKTGANAASTTAPHLDNLAAANKLSPPNLSQTTGAAPSFSQPATQAYEVLLPEDCEKLPAPLTQSLSLTREMPFNQLLQDLSLDRDQSIELQQSLQIFNNMLGDASNALIGSYVQEAREMLRIGAISIQEIILDLPVFLSSVQYEKGLTGANALQIMLNPHLNPQDLAALRKKTRLDDFDSFNGAGSASCHLIFFIRSRLAASYYLKKMGPTEVTAIKDIIENKKGGSLPFSIDTSDAVSRGFFIWLLKQLNCQTFSDQLAASIFSNIHTYSKPIMLGQLAFAHELLDAFGQNMPKQIQTVVIQFCKVHHEERTEDNPLKSKFYQPIITSNDLTIKMIQVLGNDLSDDARHELTQFADANMLLLLIDQLHQISSGNTFNICTNRNFTAAVATQLLNSEKTGDLTDSSNWPRSYIEKLITETNDLKLKEAWERHQRHQEKYKKN